MGNLVTKHRRLLQIFIWIWILALKFHIVCLRTNVAICQTCYTLFLSASHALYTILASASKRNGLDLDRHALGQLLDGNAGASGLVGEVLFVDGVHLGEVVHGGDEDVDLEVHM